MSVILDALKRVQDENRRRGVTPEARDSRERPEPEPQPNALLRRLAEPAEPRPARKREARVSPVIWVSAAFVVLVLVIAGALAWLQPSFDGPAANEGRPLLTQLEDRGTSAGSGAPVAGGAVRETFGGGSGSETGQGAGGDAPGAIPVGGPDSRAEIDASRPGDDLFADLSGSIAAADESAVDPPAGGRAADGPDDSLLRLEVQETAAPARREPAADSTVPRDSFIDLRSATPGDSGGGQAVEQRPWQPPTPPVPAPEEEPYESANSSVPNRLVDPGVRAAFAEGVRLHKSGDLNGASEAYARALKFDPHNARVNANLGVLYESQGKLVQAERHLRAAVQTEPDNASAHNNLGVVLYRQGKYDAALIEFNRTLQIDARHLDAYTNKGLIYTRWGQLEDAERAFRQVLAIDSRNALAHYNLGLVYEEMSRFDMALDEYYRFLETGGLEHPEITAYLDRHLRWLERRAEGGRRPTS